MTNISLEKVTHRYAEQAVLEDVSLAIAAGNFTSLIGPSGCGKSTVLRLIAGLEPLQAGTLTIGGKDMQNIGPARRAVGMVFQYPSLFPHLNVEENIRFGMQQGSKEEQRAEVAHWLEALGVAGYEKRYPHQLSGGEQQRVALARSLVLKPAILLLDEPFANLDALLRRSLREEVLELLKQQKITTILVTHDPSEALSISDEVIVMGQGGRIHQIASPEQIRTAPKDEFVSMLAGAA